MSSTRFLYARRFLNRPRHHLGAHVIAEVMAAEPTNRAPYVSATLHLSDCDRRIAIDFDVFDRRDARNSLHKIRLLRAVLADFEEALLKSIDAVGLTPRD